MSEITVESKSAQPAPFEIGSRLSAERQRVGLHHHDMGRKIGLSGRQVLAIEAGDSRDFRGQDSFNRALTLYAKKLGISLSASLSRLLPGASWMTEQ